jgi:hypothetical protein
MKVKRAKCLKNRVGYQAYLFVPGLPLRYLR